MGFKKASQSFRCILLLDFRISTCTSISISFNILSDFILIISPKMDGKGAALWLGGNEQVIICNSVNKGLAFIICKSVNKDLALAHHYEFKKYLPPVLGSLLLV